jgi:hypothetical protein
MADKNKTLLDERLADFTDRLLAGENLDQPAAVDSDGELEALQTTVRRARSALHVEGPDAELRNRIRARLAAEWQRSGPSARGDAGGWRSARGRSRVFVLRFAGLAALLAILAGVLAPRIGVVLPGAAKDTQGVLVGIGALLVILSLIVLWLSRKS